MRISEILILLTIWYQPAKVEPTSTITTVYKSCEVDFRNQTYSCNSNGKFSDPLDTDCTKYYLCVQYSLSYIVISLTCPDGTYFNPSIQECTSTYSCFSSQMEEREAVTTTECEVAIQNFSCTTEGQFADLNDDTCSKYYVCTGYGDSYIETALSCPQGSYFDRENSICNTNYTCSCNYSSSTTASTITGVVTSLIETTSSPSITSDSSGTPVTGNKNSSETTNTLTEFTTYSNSPTETTNISTVYLPNETTDALISSTTVPPATGTTSNVENTTEPCVINYDPEYFVCGAKGRYPNLNDPTCHTYFLCNLLRNGSYLQTTYSCPESSYFNPPLQVCDVSYRCPCQGITITSSTETTTSSTVTSDFTEITNTPSVSTVTTNTETPVPSTESTINLTDSSSTLLADVTTIVPESTTEPCVINYDPEYFVCSTKGRYPNLNDPTCHTYFLCNLLRNGSYLQTTYSCPESSYFNPPLQVCDVSYRCPCQGITITSSTETTTSSTVTSDFTEITTEPAVSTVTTSSVTSIASTESTINSTDSSSTLPTDLTTVAPESTTEPCIINYDLEYFVCSAKGRYPNLNDPTCHTYFLCNLLRNGSYLQTTYSCPESSYFNPPLQVCDVSYRCPCQGITITSSTETTTSSIVTSDFTEITTEPAVSTVTTNTETPVPSSESTINSTDSLSTLPADVTTVAPESTTEPCVINYDPEYFVCSAKGRYPNLNDPTCHTYFLCNLLRNGSYLQTTYSCPESSYFNPPLQVCDVSYRCPCQGITITSSTETTTSSIVTSDFPEITTEPAVSTVTTNTETPIPSTESTIKSTDSSSTLPADVTTVAPESTTEPCVINYDPEYFVCSAKGRYPNLNDPTCHTYFLCNLLRNGSYLQTTYSCPESSYFNPPLQVCDVSYRCPCQGITITSSTETTTSSTVTSDFTEITNTPSVSTATTNTETPVPSSESTINSTDSSSTLPADVTTVAPESTIEPCVINYDPEYFVCSTKGRYPNLNDPTCHTYFLCNLLRNGSYLQTTYSCPESSYFNPPLQVCDVSYRCPCQGITITSSTETTTSSIVTSDFTEITTEPAVSTVTTNTETPIPSTESTIKSTDSSSTLPADVTTVAPESTTEPCVINYDPEYFVCSAKGRYPNLNDPTCHTYFLCNLLRNGSYLQTTYSCPESSYFNPPLQVCDVSYRCPCQGITITSSTETTTSSTVTSDFTEIITEPAVSTVITNTETPVPSTESTINSTDFSSTLPADVTTVASESTTEPCVINYDPEYFVCSAKGRYPNLNDPTCYTYFLCNLLRNGSYLQTTYSCPESSYFNPPLQVCDVSYRCPCQGITITSSTETTTSSIVTTDFTEITTEPAVSTVTTNTETPVPSTESTINSTDSLSTLPADMTTVAPESTTEPCVINYDPEYFVCSAKGRYPNLNDPTCHTYFLCNLLRNGSYLQTTYSCPESSYFNPPLQVCDVSYRCPCQGITITSSTETTTSSTVTSDFTEITNTPSVSTATTNTETPVPSSESTINSTDSSSTLPADVTTVAPESTTEPCVINYDPEYFVCSAKGRYPNLNDPTCHTYFLCNLLRNGSYLQTTYSCPESSYFNPPLQVCDVSYRCPCQGITITSSTETTTSSIVTSDFTEITTEPAVSTVTTNTEPPVPSTESTINSTDSSSTLPADVTTVAAESTTEPCVINYDPEYFVCSTKGRYPNLNDPTCHTYFLCNLLRNGSYLQTTYSCPEASYFNPPLQVCDVSYRCPCQGITITSSTETTTSSIVTSDFTEITTEPAVSTVTTNSETPVPSTESTINSTDSSSTLPANVTTVAPESTTEPCVINYDPEYFVCSAKGRYPNLNDPTCHTYFLCNLLRNGSYLQTTYSCPESSYFNPPLQVCDVSYRCPCQGITITSSTETTTSSIVTSDFTEITTEPAVSTVTTNTETPVPSSESTINSTDSLSTLPADVTTVAPESTTEPCVINYDPEYFVCSAKGRYPNLNDPTCHTYFLCNLLRNGSYLQTTYSCPESSYFNPPLQVCDVSYRCPCQGITITSSTETTTSSIVTSDFTEITTEPAVSTTNTETPVPSTESTINSTDFSSTLPADVTTVAPESTTEPCVINYDPEYFVCSAKGRYPNLNDPTCHTYFLCNLLRNGSYLQTTYSCPESSYFNPPLQVCDVSYRCPCQGITITSSTETTTSSIVTSDFTEITTEPAVSTVTTNTETPIPSTESTINSTDSSSTLPADVTTVAPESTTEPCVINYDPEYFVCSAKGRYPNLNDPTCHTYFLCNLLRNGSYLQTTYSCPESSYFNPPLQVCDVSYRCPCQGITITSSTEITTSSIVTSDFTEITTEPAVSTVTTNTETPVPSTESTINSTDSSSTLPADVTTVAPESTTEPCVINYDPEYFVCTAKGRYPNLNDPTCHTYFLCNLLRNGSYLQTTYSCPESSYFNPPLQVCDVSYRCPCQGITITSSTETTTSSTDISGSTEITSEPAVSAVTTGTETSVSSTESTVNSTDSSSTLLTDVTTVAIESTTEPCIINYDPEYFVCSTKGRYPNLNDPTCQSYYLCNQLRNGSYLQTKYSCPDSSYFNPPLQVCDVSYTCPCQGIIITTTEATSKPTETTIEVTSSSSTSDSPESTTDVGSTTEPCIINYDPDYFACGTKGRFPNLNDPTCQSYFLCNQLRNGSYLQTKYNCPDLSYFNPPLQVCDVSYVCPCALR